MKKVLVIAMAMMLAAAIPATAQPSGEKQRADREMKTPEQIAEMRTERMAKELSLTQAQKKEVYALTLEQANARKANMEARRNAAQKQREEGKARMQKYDSKMKGILSAEQYTAWKDSNKEKDRDTDGRRDNRKGHTHRDGHGKNAKDGGKDCSPECACANKTEK